ncbi:hypothetical protein PR003_g16926 [Phytophthora rubi]|uniref:Uncharacterized protein n=1 Tax=Phytophthora rubi TaxID=129364 RepID=A0A6A3I9I2_9STRA|nr:hypothetical protein PR001_g25111 [Phytophthora rubi]KAE9323663.1 hypothetical protein PR003_g16926 [Phytophthora rubi]
MVECASHLIHGWDAHSTLKALLSSLKRGFERKSDAIAWRREVNQQQDIARSMAKEYQSTEKARRTKEHNDALGRREKDELPSLTGDEASNDDSPRSLFQQGSRV